MTIHQYHENAVNTIAKSSAGIYKLYWDNSDYFYFGQSINILNRYKQHLRGIRKGYHENKKLIEAYRLFGFPKLKILELCAVELLNEREQVYISFFFDNTNCCNLSPTAESQKGIKRTVETIEKIRLAQLGKILSPQHKINISIGVKRRGAKPPKKFGPANHFYGKQHTQEALSKMRGKTRGAGGKNIKAKLVLNIETGIYYDCAEEAANVCNIKGQYLRGMLNGHKKNKTSFIYV